MASLIGAAGTGEDFNTYYDNIRLHRSPPAEQKIPLRYADGGLADLGGEEDGGWWGAEDVGSMPHPTFGEDMPLPKKPKSIEDVEWITAPHVLTHAELDDSPFMMNSIYKWRALHKKINGKPHLILEVNYYSDTVIRHIIQTNQITGVVMKKKVYLREEQVIFNMAPASVRWNPQEVKITFYNPENSIAFQASMIEILSSTP
jgi:hypothetical protein